MADGEQKRGFLQTLCQSLLCAVCVAPLAVLGAIFLTAHNERSSVCVMHAVDDGYATVETVDCHPAKHSQSDDDLFMFRCPLDKDASKFGPTWEGYHDFTSFGPLHFDGVGLHVDVQMYQCIESESTSNGTTTYSYSKGFYSGQAPRLDGPYWRSYCGESNPSWPSGVPTSAWAHAPVVKAGAYELSQNMINSIALDTPVEPISGHGSSFEWRRDNREGAGVYLASGNLVPRRLDNGEFVSHNNFDSDGNHNGNVNGNGNSNFNNGGSFNGNSHHHLPNAYPLGTMRATFTSNSWEDVAVLGHERNGKMEEWKAPDAWLCSGYGLETLRQSSTLDKEAMFSTLHAENKMWTILLRILAFCIFWGAFAAMVEPLGVIADFMPFIGGCLGDAFDVIQIVVSCLPATACFFTIAGVMYVVMRPAVGAPMLLGVAAIVGLMTFAKVNRKQKEGGGGTEGEALMPAPAD